MRPRINKKEDPKTEVEYINEHIKTANTAFNLFIFFAVYCFIAAAGIRDEHLVLNSLNITLPVFNIQMEIAAFFTTAIILLSFFYIYWNLYLFKIDILLFQNTSRRLKIDPKQLTPTLFSSDPVKSPLKFLQDLFVTFIRWYFFPLIIWFLGTPLIKLHHKPYFTLLLLSTAVAFALSLLFNYLSTHSNRKPKSHVPSVINRLVLTLLGLFALTSYVFWIIPDSIRGNQIHTPLFLSSSANTLQLQDKTLAFDTCNCKDQIYKGYRNTHFEGADMENTVFTNINFYKANFTNAHLLYTDFRCSDFRHAIFDSADMHGVNFTHSDLRYINFHPAKGHMHRVNFKDADMQQDTLIGVDFYLVNFEGARLWKAVILRSENLTADMLCKASNLNGITLDSALYKKTCKSCEDRFRPYIDSVGAKFPYK